MKGPKKVSAKVWRLVLIEMLLPPLFLSNGLGVLWGDRELLQSLNYDGSYHKWEANQQQQKLESRELELSRRELVVIVKHHMRLETHQPFYLTTLIPSVQQQNSEWACREQAVKASSESSRIRKQLSKGFVEATAAEFYQNSL